MNSKSLLVFLFCSLFSITIVAQCDDNISVTDGEEVSFVTIYKAFKNRRVQVSDERLFQLLEDKNLTREDYLNMTRRLEKSIKTQAKAKYISDIESLKTEIQTTNKALLKELCDIRHMDIKRYERLLHQYRTCIRFQRSLKSLF